VKTLFIEPGSPWENGYCEGFNSKLRDELLAGELFSTLYEAKVPIERSSASPLACASTRPAEGLATRGRVLTQCLAPN
jgi:hypothetical protein